MSHRTALALLQSMLQQRKFKLDKSTLGVKITISTRIDVMGGRVTVVFRGF